MRIVSMLVLASALWVAGGAGCRREKAAPARELMIYCGITMTRPMLEIAEQFERETGCRVVMTKGGTGDLLKSIRASRVGDLYLPGTEKAIETCRAEGLVEEAVPVGCNRAVMMVQKGNPKGLTADLATLARKDLYVVIGNPESGSIGMETARILRRAGLFEAVIANARRLTTDSKDLVAVLVSKEADVVVNWQATATWPENEPYVDVLVIDPELAKPDRLVLGLLTVSTEPELARRFMAMASSEQGQEIFRRNGLGKAD